MQFGINQAILAFYFLSMLGIGTYFSRKQSDSESYFLAERGLGKHHLTATAFSTFLGAGFVFIVASFGYLYGISIFLVILALLGGLTFFVYGVRRLKEKSYFNDSITLPQVMEKEWDERTRELAALFTILIFVASLATNLLIAGEILHTVYGIQQNIALTVFGVMVIVYTTLGGFKGVTWTDIVQVFVIFGGMVFLLAIAASEPARLISNLPPGHLSLTNIPPRIMVGYVLLGLFAFYGGQDVFQRIFAAKDAESAHTGFTRFSILIGILSVISVTIGVIAKSMFPDIRPEQAIPVLTSELAGNGVSAIILAAYLSMANSSADSQMLTIASNLREDFGLLEGWGEIRANRLLVVVIGGFALVLSLLLPSLVDLAGAMASWFAILGFVVASSLFWDKATERGAFYSLSVGFALAIGFSILTRNFQMATAVGLLPAMFTMFIVSRLWPKH